MGFDAWSETIWLPEGVHWTDFESHEVNGTYLQFPRFSDLRYSIVCGAVLLVVRILIECFVFVPFASLGGWLRLPAGKTTLDVCLQHLNFGFAGRSKLKRVSETAWRFIFYTCIWFYGLYALRDQPQWSNLDESWLRYPFHQIDDVIWYYYIIETGFYWSLLFSAFTIDVKRSDFWEMATHHAVTILLLSMSFTINFVRAGTMVLICHDTADIFLEGGKLLRYGQYERALTVVFCMLMFTWISTRIFYFPLVIIRSVIVTAPSYLQKDFRWFDLTQRPIVPRVFLAMLLILLCLHMFWTVILFRIAYQSTQKTNGIDDLREDESSGDEIEAVATSADKKKGQ